MCHSKHRRSGRPCYAVRVSVDARQAIYGGAERAYLKLMRAAPSGTHALLLARFYEDTQQTSSARRWIREAVRLDPSYGEEAERLRDKLSTSHFGCFQAYRERSSRN